MKRVDRRSFLHALFQQQVALMQGLLQLGNLLGDRCVQGAPVHQVEIDQRLPQQHSGAFFPLLLLMAEGALQICAGKQTFFHKAIPQAGHQHFWRQGSGG